MGSSCDGAQGACGLSNGSQTTTCVYAEYGGRDRQGNPLPGSDWGVVGTGDTECRCVQGLPYHEFAPCPTPSGNRTINAECGCPAECLGTDPYYHECELPCPNGQIDCPVNAHCVAETFPPPGMNGCRSNLCADAGIPCLDPQDGKPGSCMPMWTVLGPSLYCFEGGGAFFQGSRCNPDPYVTRRDLVDVCAEGLYCLPTGPDAGSCTAICDPNQTKPVQPCPTGTHCGVIFDGMPGFGACVACLPRRAPCQTNADCCSGECEPGCSFNASLSGWGQGCMECR